MTGHFTSYETRTDHELATPQHHHVAAPQGTRQPTDGTQVPGRCHADDLVRLLTQSIQRGL